MSNEENLAVVRAAYTAFNDRDYDRAASLVTPDAGMVVVPFGITYVGPDGFRAFQRSWIDAFPDARSEIRTMTADGGRVAVEHVGLGTHDGTLAGPGGAVPPSGRPVEIPFFDVFELRGGRIVGLRSYFDSATLLRQVGAIPAEAGV